VVVEINDFLFNLFYLKKYKILLKTNLLSSDTVPSTGTEDLPTSSLICHHVSFLLPPVAP
jgi:hypothetical protein